MRRTARRNRVSRHPWTATITTTLTILLMVPMAYLAEAWGVWEMSRWYRYGALLFIALPPILLTLAVYDPLTTWLDRRLDQRLDRDT